MNKLYIYAALILALIGFVKWYSDRQYDAGYNACQVESVTKIKEAIKAALEKEREAQEQINAGLQEQYNEINSINARLNADLDRLRNRPSRASLSKTTKANCKGVSGAELAKEHAGFLAGYAAQAAKQDAALTACYNYADSIQ